MKSVCLYFEVHQPYRLKPYDVFQVGKHHDYFNEALNAEVMQRVARHCYLPANETILRLIERHKGRFKVAFSITGTAIEQMQAYAPEALESFQKLVATSSVELLSETYHHSLASVYDKREFVEQVALHRDTLQALFGVTPRVFRNTELIYDDALAHELEALDFSGVLAEGADDILGGQSPHHVYRAPGTELAILTKDYRRSDDIAFRFAHPQNGESKLSAEAFAKSLHEQHTGNCISLFMDYETFGEHYTRDSGIFDFLSRMPEAVLTREDFRFATPSEIIADSRADGLGTQLSYPRSVSWADTERDLSAWCGNEMQTKAIRQLYKLGERIRRRKNPAQLQRFRKLSTSDHVYYMCTKWFGDDAVHAYFSPYESPYEAFINFMNALSDLEEWTQRTAPLSLIPDALEPA